MVIDTEPSTPIHRAVLQDPPASTTKYVVHLLGHSTYMAILNPLMQVRVLIPGARNPQVLRSSKVHEKGAVLASEISSRAMGITAGYCTEVAQCECLTGCICLPQM